MNKLQAFHALPSITQLQLASIISDLGNEKNTLHIENITCPRADTNLIFEKIKFVSTSGHSVYYINNNIKEILAISRRFPNILPRCPKVFENTPKTVRSSYEHFQSFSENFRSCAKNLEDVRISPSNLRRCFDHIEINLRSFNNSN